MLWIIRILILDCLPPALLVIAITNLKDRRRNQHGKRQPLGIHPSLHQLLRGTQIRTSPYYGESGSHTGNPGDADDFVAVFFAKGHEAFVAGLLRDTFGAGFGGGVFEL